MEPIEVIRLINYALAIVFFVCYAYQIFYIAVPFFRRDKPHGQPALDPESVLISAPMR